MALFNEEERAEILELARKMNEDGMDANIAQREAAKEVAERQEETEPDPQLQALMDSQKETSETLEKFMKYMQEVPAIKNVGYFTDDGGEADPEVKSFGDFLLAVKRGDTKRLAAIYKSTPQAWANDPFKTTKDIETFDGPAGGYLIPEEFDARLLEVSAPQTVVRANGATSMPVASASGRIPSLDQNTAPTAGQGDSAFAGGVVANWVAAGGTLTETQPTFEQVEYTIRKLAGFTEVENEVLADSAIGIETLLTRLFSRTVAAMEDYAFLRGNGAAEPLGILNAAVAVGITPATNNAFAYADALTMRSRFKSVGGSPVWAIHPGVWPDIGIFEVSGGSGGVFQANLAGALNQSILGWPIVESEHLPQDDNSGNVLLADFAAYLILDRMQMAVAFSEHAAFTTDKGTWRFVKRLDGQPWMSGAIPLADPQGSFTVSPFIFHND